VFKYVELETMLTVVDSSHFLELYASKSDIKDLPHLIMDGKAASVEGAHIDRSLPPSPTLHPRTPQPYTLEPLNPTP
jgi:hypothetical protein